MARHREARTLLEHCVARGGYIRGARVAQFVIEWTLCAADLGHQPSAREFARWWKDGSESTVWRRLALFQELFPQFENPAPLAEHLVAAADKGRLSLDRTALLGARVALS